MNKVFHLVNPVLDMNMFIFKMIVFMKLAKFEVDALGVITISRGCFERCGSNKKTPP